MQKFLSRWFLSSLLAISSIKGNTQNPTYIPNYIPPSPNVAALMKFVDVPVSPYTGTSNISVPIFQIDAKGVKVPISLDYHTGGIKVSEESGMVGLGWALTAGGSISRTVMDKDDFQGTAYFTTLVPQVSGDMSNSKPPQAVDNTGQFVTQDYGPYFYDFGCNYLVNTSGGQENFNNLLQAAAPSYDAEPDQFSYNFLGHSGKFIIGRNRTIIFQQQENLKITFDAGNTPNFQITDDQGNRFLFNTKDCNTNAAYGTCITNTWNLTQIITQLNDTVNFNYTLGSTQASTKGDITQSMIYGTSNDGFQQTNSAGTFYGNQILTSIDFRAGQLQFNYDAIRSDLKGGVKYNNIKIYSKTGSALTYVKEFDLFYSNYTPPSAAVDSFENKRMMLDSVKELSGTLKNPPYSFRYIFPTVSSTGALAKHGFNIDHWGYFNYAGNSGLIPSESVFFNKGTPYSNIPAQWIQYSGANRSVDPNYNTTFLLNTIYYPTGGKSVLEYESNSYDVQKSTTGPTDFPQVNVVVFQQQLQAYNVGETTGSVDFSYIYPILQTGSSVTNATMLLTFRCSSPAGATALQNGTYGQVSFSFSGQNANLAIDIKDVSCSGSVCTATYPLTITGGNMVYNWDGHISASAGSNFQDIRVTIQYNEIQQIVNQILNNNYVAIAGGVRVKSVTDFSSASTPVKKRVYQYEYTMDTNGDGIPESYSYGRLMDFPSYVRYQFMSVSSVATISFMNISGSTSASMTSQVHNNIVGYDKVIERAVDPLTNIDIGKTEYDYFNSADSSVSYFGGYNQMGISVMNNNLNGVMLHKIDSALGTNNLYTKVKEVDNFYSLKNRSVYFSPRLMNAGPKLDGSRYCGGTSADYQWTACFYPSMKSEKLLLDSTWSFSYDQFDVTSAQQIRTLNYYDNPKHFQITRSKSFDSKNNMYVSFNKYPQDYLVDTNTWTRNTIIDSLIGRHMVSAIIERGDSIFYNGAATGGKVIGAQLSLFKTLGQNALGFDKQYQLDKTGPIGNFVPFSFSGNTITKDSRYRQMISFDSYDVKNNVQQYSPVDQTAVSMVWDYNGSMPIAQVKNAINSDIAFTSFEADGVGNWSFPVAGINTSTALTGSKSYNISGRTITKSGLTIGGKYIISYWSNGAACSIMGATYSSASGRTVNGWTYYQHLLTTSASTVSITGTVTIDELRLYPQAAQMNSITYTPLYGETTVNDQNSEIIFYEYDNLQRLKNIKDYRGNIIKNYQYNYAASCTACKVIMQTMAGTPTLSYPVGVFSVSGQLLGNASTPAQYISIWNSNTANTSIGTLAIGSDSMHFILNMVAGKNSPGFVTGCRYYQYDFNGNVLDAIANANGCFVDYGDGANMKLGNTPADTSSMTLAANTIIKWTEYYNDWFIIAFYGGQRALFVHTYADSSLRTITIYHNDLQEEPGLYSYNMNLAAGAKLTNVRGVFPQHMNIYRIPTYTKSSSQNVSNIYNWNSISSITYFEGGFGATYMQNFMANNLNLETIYLHDSTVISTLKSDWNTTFLRIKQIECDYMSSWVKQTSTQQNISKLTNLNFFVTSGDHVNIGQQMTSSQIDNFYNQLASGAGANIKDGVTIIIGAAQNTPASQASVHFLLNTQNWVLTLDEGEPYYY